MSKIRLFFRINGIFFILFWMLLFFQPSISLRIIILITSIEILMAWAIGLFVARTTAEYNNRKVLLILSMITLIIWFLLLCIPEIWEFIASLAIVILWIWAIIKWILLFISWLKAREAGITNRWMMLALWVIAILFWIFLTCNAFLTLLVINVLLGFAMTFFWILLMIRWFQAKETSIEWIDGLNPIEEYDDNDDD